jgi:hypothetical protein
LNIRNTGAEHSNYFSNLNAFICLVSHINF